LKRYFITAIGTDSGKSLVSAIFTQALQADYWKPVQAGHPRDTELVRSLVSSPRSAFHPEAYCLGHPLSPHAAAKLDGVEIALSKINLPATSNHLVIEGAGGLLVPLNDQQFVVDLADKFAAEVVLVCNLYLGSINHTLLSLRELSRRLPYSNFTVRGIVFNQGPVPESERIIEQHCPYPCLLRIEKATSVDQTLVAKYAAKLRRVLSNEIED
jgi:dethiobiotin synthetase